MKTFLFSVVLLLAGCSAHFVHENGQTQSCSGFGVGRVGIAASAISKAICKSDAQKLGFHRFNVDSGITGIFVGNYVAGKGLEIVTVWPNSNAWCSGVTPGLYLFKVGEEEVTACDDAYDLMDNCTDKTIQITLIDHSGNSRTVDVQKITPGKMGRCTET